MNATGREVRILSDLPTLHRAAAEQFAATASEAIRLRGVFTVALSGGSTPRGMYSLLATDPALRPRVSWDKVQFYWGDERHVSPDDPESNYRMANESLLSKLSLEENQVFRIKAGYASASQAAEEYEQVLRKNFHLGPNEFPAFDLILLGMGPEGHTASLFPGTRALHESKRLVVANWVGKFYTDRITFTPPVINHARSVLFLISGKDKALALKAVFEGPLEPDQLPAQLVDPHSGRSLWLIDAAAGEMLSRAGS